MSTEADTSPKDLQQLADAIEHIRDVLAPYADRPSDVSSRLGRKALFASASILDLLVEVKYTQLGQPRPSRSTCNPNRSLGEVADTVEELCQHGWQPALLPPGSWLHPSVGALLPLTLDEAIAYQRYGNLKPPTAQRALEFTVQVQQRALEHLLDTDADPKRA